MPRKPRMFLPEIPCHIIQRGNNRSVCFFTEQDYFFYLHCLFEACVKYDVSLHAYVLMTNHVHLLMTPKNSQGISRVMQSVGRRYVQYINKKHNRTGTLFEGRFKASIVEAESYFLACMCYIELNPVRANMVVSPIDYRWSSFQVNAGYKKRKSLAAHASYLALSSNESRVCLHYRELFEQPLSPEGIHDITLAINHSMPLGNDRFKKQIEQVLGRSIGHEKAGRPVVGL